MSNSFAGSGWLEELHLAPLPDTVQLWCADFEAASPHLASLRKLLSPDELQRAERFKVEPARASFVVARAALRLLLAGALDRPPREIEFVYTPSEKPLLAGNTAPTALHFNVSHSGGIALIALARHRRIGVDVEQVESKPNLISGARSWLAPAECACLDALPAGEQMAAFYRIWTRKEAVLKAAGHGITAGLHEPDVATDGDQAASRSGLQVRQADAHWRIWDFLPRPHYVAALALEDPPEMGMKKPG